MVKYVLRRLLHGLISVVIVIAIVMILIYSLMDRNLVFGADPVYRNLGNNQKKEYKYRQWENYGYLDYVPYADYLTDLLNKGEIDQETFDAAKSIGDKPKKDSAQAAKYVKNFEDYYKSRGYTIKRLDAVKIRRGRKYASGGKQTLFAYRDKPLITRLISYFGHIITVDNIHYVDQYTDIGKRGLTFTWHDPAAEGKFSPAIIGNGTKHKYLLYTDGKFPFIHQNLITISLGTSYTVNAGVDVFDTMNLSQGSYVTREMTFPSGAVQESADDLHSATYVKGSRDSSAVNQQLFTDDYTAVSTVKSGKSKIGYSFTLGIIAVILAYVIAFPLGVAMALKKDKLIDQIGTVYIVFILAVPSLAYIFLFKAIGSRLGLPTTFNMESASKAMYVLPIVSLALPSIADLMKWLRRYMIDQMNSDYVKFARSGGLSERQIFRKHILKNAIIPIVHGIPGSVLGALVGAIITERVYVVPGAGNLLTEAINKYDNGVIVGVTLFYALLSVVSIILGDVLMSIVDPRISFNSKAR